MPRIKVNKRSDTLFLAVFINWISILCRIQQKFFDAVLRKVSFHGKEGMKKRKHVVPGSPFQKREYREVTMGIGSHIHVEVVTEEITFSMGIPAPVAVRL